VAESRRKAQQETLAAEKNAETLARLTAAKERSAAAAGPSAASDFTAYSAVSAVPSEHSRSPQLYVDRGKEAVLLPISGQLVPFHIGTVKNVSSSQEGAATFIRIQFNVPGGVRSFATTRLIRAADTANTRAQQAFGGGGSYGGGSGGFGGDRDRGGRSGFSRSGGGSSGRSYSSMPSSY
jgi:hypothetical protein